MSRFSQFTASAVLGMAMVAGCASHTTRTETVTYQNDPYGSDRTVERRTTTTETTDQHSGVLSSTVNTVGDVVAFPFRVVGGAIRALF